MHGLLLESAVKKGVMNGLAVLEQDDAQGTVIHFRDARPAPDPSIRLAFFPQRILDNALDPFILNHNTVGTLTGVKKVLRRFQVREV
jgi:hypothetical protein